MEVLCKIDLALLLIGCAIVKYRPCIMFLTLSFTKDVYSFSADVI